MQSLMREADLKDPLTSCSAVGVKCDPDYSGRLMIAARGDLTPVDGKYPFPDLAHFDLGALDTKITSFEYIQKFQIRAISSPPYEKVPAFDWTTIADFKVTHKGLPEKWEFPWFDISYDAKNWGATEVEKKKKQKAEKKKTEIETEKQNLKNVLFE